MVAATEAMEVTEAAATAAELVGRWEEAATEVGTAVARAAARAWARPALAVWAVQRVAHTQYR